MRLLPLIGATYFMVSGGPYGLEDILGMAGYKRALLLLLLIPVFWSLPTALMVGELTSAIPEEGGYYRWVRRAMGPLWGFQESWLTLASSIFDMAIYPTSCVLYLGYVAPSLTAGSRGVAIKVLIVTIAMLWNLRGAVGVGVGSVRMAIISLAPFVILVGAAIGHAVFMVLHSGNGLLAGLAHVAAPGGPPATLDMAGAVSVAMWNYMGWDNAATIAEEVDDPQRTYPRAILASALAVMVVYCIPLGAVWLAGIPAERFVAGAWADAAGLLGGPALALAVVLAGSLDGLGTYNALTLSLTRLPYAMAKDGLGPKALTRVTTRGVPWVSVIACSVAWALALSFTFERLISIDLVLYGGALVLEFVALIVLRVREPQLARPFRVPGGLSGVLALAAGPVALIAFALWAARGEHVAGMNALLFAAIVAAAGPLVYAGLVLWNQRRAVAV
jgi:amino acid transporter